MPSTCASLSITSHAAWFHNQLAYSWQGADDDRRTFPLSIDRKLQWRRSLPDRYPGQNCSVCRRCHRIVTGKRLTSCGGSTTPTIKDDLACRVVALSSFLKMVGHSSDSFLTAWSRIISFAASFRLVNAVYFFVVCELLCRQPHWNKFIRDTKASSSDACEPRNPFGGLNSGQKLLLSRPTRCHSQMQHRALYS